MKSTRRQQQTAHRRQVGPYLVEAKAGDFKILPTPQKEIELIWRDEHGTIQRKIKPWRGNDDRLSAWIHDYFEKLDNGYHPKGFSVPPRPHCARIHSQGKVIAEWIKR